MESVSGAWAARSASQATAALNIFSGDTGSGGSQGLVPPPPAGAAAAAKFLKADSTWAVATVSGLGSALQAGNNLTDVNSPATALANLSGQPLNSNLTTLGGLTPGNGQIIRSVSSAWQVATVSQAWQVLALAPGINIPAYNDARFTTITANNQTGTSYSLALSDAGCVVELNNASGITLTVTKNATVSWPNGTVIEIWQQGAGQVTITADTGVTLRSDGGKVKTAAQYATVSLRRRATDEWVLSGDLA
jgi:hypothetical protein